MRMQRWLGTVLLAGSVFAAGCRQRAIGSMMDREAFIEVMVALRKEAVASPDSLVFDARRAAILADAGVTDSALYGFVRAMERRPDEMSAIWDVIDARVNAPSTEEADTVRVR